MERINDLTRHQCINLLDEAVSFGTAKQRRVIKALIDANDLTVLDLIEDCNPATDAELRQWVAQVGYGVEVMMAVGPSI